MPTGSQMMLALPCAHGISSLSLGAEPLGNELLRRLFLGQFTIHRLYYVHFYRWHTRKRIIHSYLTWSYIYIYIYIKRYIHIVIYSYVIWFADIFLLYIQLCTCLYLYAYLPDTDTHTFICILTYIVCIYIYIYAHTYRCM